MGAEAKELRVLVVAPSRRDGPLTANILRAAGFSAGVCETVGEVPAEMGAGCGMLLVAEEALHDSELKLLIAALDLQPSWSDLPLALVSGDDEDAYRTRGSRKAFGPKANVTILERPFRRATLVNTVDAALRARRRQYEVRDLLEQRETILRSIQDSFITLDPNWRYTYINDAASRLSGQAMDGMLGRNFWEVSPDLVGSKLQTEFRRAMKHQIPIQFEHFSQRRSRWFEIRLYPSAQGLSVLAADITARKETEQALAQSEERHRFLSEISTVFNSALDPAVIFRNLAELAVPRLGDFCFVDMIMPSGMVERIAAAQADSRQEILQALGVGRVLPTEAQNAFPGRKTAIFSPEAGAERSEAGGGDGLEGLGLGPGLQVRSLIRVPLIYGDKVLGALTFCCSEAARCFTEADFELAKELAERATLSMSNANLYREARATNEELERRVSERTSRLKEMVAELEAFSYSVSHDLRAPLRAMQGFAQALIEDFSDRLGPEGVSYLDRLARAASRLDSLTQDVLRYSRITRDEIRLEPVNLDLLVTEVIQQYPEFREPRGLIHIRLPLGVVLGQRSGLTQCISNLVGNALKFVPPDRAPHISIYSEERDGKLRLVVEDNGIGIESRHYQRIFGMFERVHAEGQFEGTGIGLAIVRKAVERMGGGVGLESELGRGSRFWIELTKWSGT